jgi:hypothetical protein
MRLVGIRLLFNEQKGDKPLIKSFPDLEDAQTRRVKHSGLVNFFDSQHDFLLESKLCLHESRKVF